MLTMAIILGFAGSLHCAGMCSPLAVAITHKAGWLNRVLYNGGRILMYSFLGALLGSIGVVLPAVLQYSLSILLGISLLIIGITGSNFITPVFRPVYKVTNFLKSVFSNLLQKKNALSVFGMGILNGLLPCGLTFLALTSSITIDGPVGGFIFMAAFGSGTLPVMLGLVSVVPLLANKLRFNVNRVATGLQIVAGCLLIARVLLVDISSHPVIEGVDSITVCP